MATLIYPDSIPYCSATDVQNILGSINYSAPITQDTGYLNSVIAESTQYFETQTDRRFCPVHHNEFYDGTGMPRIILQHHPVLAITYVNNYINAQMLSVIQHDYQLQTERRTGIISIPLSYTTSASVQYTQAFYRGNRNVQADYWSGASREVKGETLTSTDNLTFTFANSTLAQTLQEQLGPLFATPPVYRPIVYVNGVQLVNTTYQFVNTSSGTAWNVVADNIYYTVNWTAGTITFNAPQAGNIVTSDYEYYYIPSDVARAVTKLSAIQILQIEGIGQGGAVGQGASAIQMDGFKATYGKQSAFPWEGQITTWQSDIQATITKYLRRSPDMTGGFYASGWGSYS